MQSVFGLDWRNKTPMMSKYTWDWSARALQMGDSEQAEKWIKQIRKLEGNQGSLGTLCEVRLTWPGGPNELVRKTSQKPRDYDRKPVFS